MKFGAVFRQLGQSLLDFVAVVRAILKEVFEESAYARFLDRHGISSSREAYARFLHESETVRVRRPHCC